MCSSDFIVRFFSSVIRGDQLWLLMEYVAGGSAHHVLRKCGPFPEAVCAVVAHDTLAALAYLNRDGRLHLDIKPANILITLDGHCKVCDLGVAQALGSGERIRTLSENPDSAASEEKSLCESLCLFSSLYILGNGILFARLAFCSVVQRLFLFHFSNLRS